MDYLPWRDDGDDVDPDISIITPSNNDEFINVPSVSIELYDYYGISTTWYECIGYSGNITFVGNSFQLSSTIWNQLNIGDSLTIRVHVNDTSGHENFADITIKRIEDETPAEPDNFTLIILMVVIIGIGAVIGIAAFLKYKQKGNMRPDDKVE